MFSSAVSAALSDISAALDVLADVDLAALDAGDLIRLAGRCETLARRQAVLGGDIAVQVGRREIRELGGAPHKVLADWLRITPAAARRRATMAEPLIPRISLAGEPLPPRQPATAAGWRAGELDADHVRVIQRFLAELPCAVTLAGREWAEGVLAGHARDLRPDQLATLAQKLALILNPDGTFSDADRALRRGLRFERQLPNGMSRVVLWATPALRAELEAWMAKFAAPGMANPADRTPLAEGEPSQAQADADVGLLFLPDSRETGAGFLPGKVWELLAGGRPVLALVPPAGAAARELEAIGAEIVATGDQAAARAAVERLVDRWRAGELAARPLSAATRERISRQAHAEALAGLIRGAVSRRGAGAA